jgi:hypothetical protein
MPKETNDDKGGLNVRSMPKLLLHEKPYVPFFLGAGSSEMSNTLD